MDENGTSPGGRRSSRPLRPLADVAGGVLRRLDAAGNRHKAEAVLAWREVIPEQIDRHTRGFALRDGELLVFVDSSVWANELSLMSEEMRTRLNTHLGKDLVSSIRFTVSKHARDDSAAEDALASAESPDERESAPSEPLDQCEAAQIEHLSAAIADEDLRALVTRVMRLDQEQKKGRRSAGGKRSSEG
jgi:hypothetical protein